MITARAVCGVPLVALLAAAAVGALGAEGGTDAASQPHSAAGAESAHRLALSLRLLLGVFALFISFLAVSFLTVRLLRRYLARSARTRGRTAYVDAWSRYRVTPEDIQRATSEPGGEGPTGPPKPGG